MQKKAIQDKLNSVKYNCDNTSHLVANQKDCVKCKDKACCFICPAGVYSENENGIVIQYENCLECGACKIICDKIEWHYPKSSYGVVFKNS